MFDLETSIKVWRQELFHAGLVDAETLNELECHLREEIDGQILLGKSETESFQYSIEKLGNGESLKQEFAKNYRSQKIDWRDRPIILNIVTTWLILIGLCVAGTPLTIWMSASSTWRGYLTLGWRFAVSSQILTGIGLLLRRKYWRGLLIRGLRCLLTFHLVNIGCSVYAFPYPSILTHPNTTNEMYAWFGLSFGVTVANHQFVGMILPILNNLMLVLNPLMVLCAYYLFARQYGGYSPLEKAPGPEAAN